MISGFLFFRLRMQMLFRRGGKWSFPYWVLAGLCDFSCIFAFCSFFGRYLFFWLSFILFFWLFVFGNDPPHIGWWLDYAIVEFDFHKIASRSWLLVCRQLANPPWWKLLPLSESDFVNPNAYQSPQTWGYGNSQFRAEIAWIWSSDAISVVGNQMIRRDPHKAFGESMSTLNRHQRMKKHGFLTRNNIRR